VALIRSKLTGARVAHEIVVYPGAAHAFFWEATPSFDRAARDAAWQRVEAFLPTPSHSCSRPASSASESALPGWSALGERIFNRPLNVTPPWLLQSAYGGARIYESKSLYDAREDQ
jgi:hypothetical protein